MNERSDMDRVLRHWFEDGPATMPDRVVDVVAHRISVRPQRRSWRLLGRSSMNPILKWGAAAAAVLIVAVVGYNLLPRTAPGPGGQPSTSPSPAATAAPTATVAGIRDVPDVGSRLDPGQWRFQLAADGSGPSVVADIPAGWVALDGQHGIENASATNSAPGGIAILFERPAHGLFSDPCHWDRSGTGAPSPDGDVAMGPTVADLVSALQSNTSYLVGTPTDIAFGTYAGRELELRFPADLEPATCDQATGDDSGSYRLAPDVAYAQGKANIWRLSIVDVVGARLVAIIEFFPGTSPDTLAEAKAIVASFEFTP